MPDTSPGVGASAALNRYWTAGPGLARWADSPTPFRTLRAALLKEGVPEHMVDGLAAEYYHRAKGEWPGRQARNAAMALHPKDRG